MAALYREYGNLILPQPAAKLGNGDKRKEEWNLITSNPWGHNILLIEKVKEKDIRFRYMRKTLENGWSRDVLKTMIDNGSHLRVGTNVSNFDMNRIIKPIGLILCQNKKKVVAVYALREIKTPIEVSEYELTRALPAELQSSLPAIEEIEGELGE